MNQIPKALGRAGDGIKHYRPKRNISRLINRLAYGKPKGLPLSALIVQQKQYPDVSFYQGDIDWGKMASRTDAIVLRAGQNVWADSKFLVNYRAAKERGMLRGVYWFNDDRVDPGRQAAKLLELIGDDLPEMEVFADWENTYGGAFGGLRNVVAFMQAIERALPVRVGLYTGYYWFIEHSNAILNYSQYQYLKDKPLWLGYYAAAQYVKIPPPWTALTHWQFGTPVDDYGQVSAEIDMNYFNGSISEFYRRYQAPAPELPPDEGNQTMAKNKVTITWGAGARERSQPRVSSLDQSGALLPAGGVHYSDFDPVPDITDPANPDKRWIKLQSGWYIATRYPSSTGNPERARVEPVIAEPEPVEEPEYVTLHYAGGRQVKYVRYVPE